MSSSNGEGEVITLSDVEEQYNFIERLTQHLGVEDNLTAALLANQARIAEFERKQTEMLSIISGQPVEVDAPLQVSVVDPIQVDPPDVNPDIEVIVENLTPSVDLPDDVAVDIEGIEIDQDEISAAFRDAVESVNRLQLYNVASSGSGDNLLSQPIRPAAESSSFRISVALDTTTTFTVVQSPDDEEEFTQTLNQGGQLNSDALREFHFDVSPDSQYNFRMGAAGNVKTLRIQEVFVE